ncbi:MAG TPA: PQQ-binding-like beta-propeller repeat protein, partial [Kofleriaceae bacterium]|nr:PQQ-binding-like beta-propeller repeat protein [Kofleriaceae bacterium]
MIGCAERPSTAMEPEKQLESAHGASLHFRMTTALRATGRADHLNDGKGSGATGHVRAWHVSALALAAAAGACDATGDEAAATERRCLSVERAADEDGAGTSECDWPQAGRSPRRTGYNDGESILSPETVGGLVAAWVTPIGDDPAADDLARPVVWRGSVFVTAGRELVSLDAATGEERWRFAGPVDSFLHAPAVGSGRVHATNVDAVFGIDADTGAELWRAPPPAMDFSVGAPVVSGDAVYITADSIAQPRQAEVHAIAAATGEPLWRFASSGAIAERRAAVADGRIYAANPSSEVLALDTADGAEAWVHGFADGQVGSAAVSRGLVVVPWLVCCGDMAQAIQAVDAGTGAEVWRTDLACTLPLDFSPVIDGIHVYAACDAPGGGVEVTVEGALASNGDFEATLVMAKCASKYDPSTHQMKDGTAAKALPVN